MSWFETVDTREVYTGWSTVRIDRVRTPDGGEMVREIVDHLDAVAALEPPVERRREDLVALPAAVEVRRDHRVADARQGDAQGLGAPRRLAATTKRTIS